MERQPISLLSFLEAENMRLRQAAVELSFDTMVLRKALARMRSAETDAKAGLRNRRRMLAHRVMLVYDRNRAVAE